MWDLIVSIPDHCLSFYLEMAKQFLECINSVLSVTFRSLTNLDCFLSN